MAWEAVVTRSPAGTPVSDVSTNGSDVDPDATGGPGADLVLEAIVEDDDEELFSLLKRHYDAFRRGEDSATISHPDIGTFNSDAMARSFAEHGLGR